MRTCPQPGGPAAGAELAEITSTQATLIAAQAARRERLRRQLVSVHWGLLALTAPGVIAVYAVDLWLHPCWQFAADIGLAIAMCASWSASAVLARRGRIEASAGIVYVSVWAMSNGVALLRENTLLITLIANLGVVVLVWVMAPRRVVLAGTLSGATIVAIRILLHLGVLPLVRSAPIAELLFDVTLLAVVWPVILLLLRLGAKANEAPFEVLEATARDQEHLIQAVTRVQPVLAGLVHTVESSTSVVASGATQQAATAENVANATRRLEETVQLTGTATEQARAIADQTRDNSRATWDGLDEVDRRLQDYLASLQRTVATIEAFAERSQATDAVIGAIEEVHGRVKILAINAAIEAVRAGEAGRGIGIVASEMRNLIMGTEESLRTGRDLLAGIRRDAEATAREATEAASTLAEHLEALHTARDLVKSNLQSFVETGQTIATIAESSVAQREQIAVVSRAMRELRSSANGLTQSADSLLESMRQMTVAHGSLEAIVRPAGAA